MYAPADIRRGGTSSYVTEDFGMVPSMAASINLNPATDSQGNLSIFQMFSTASLETRTYLATRFGCQIHPPITIVEVLP